ncbi:hypothetical protein ACH42_00055 [Endozoicomonas sp. (ex Bugula neritina AB1)]|nr:hypothetical protein ACH42_00055 [Endozoicomonas sp. (ex Bugula neritina AB1)]
MTDPLFTRTADNRVHYYINDHLGTPQKAFRRNGKVTWKAKISAFGETEVWAKSELRNNLRFPGQYFDAETGLHYNYFRDYAAGLGRYVQSDPLGLAAGMNTYGYVFQNPINAMDLTGLDAIPLIFPDYSPAMPKDWWGIGGSRPLALGHAGILLINPDSGFTKYYEFGRYNALEGECGCGAVQSYSVSNAVMRSNGRPTQASLDKIFRKISKLSGGGGRIAGAYVPNNNFNKMNQYSAGRLAQNSNPKRAPYDFSDNNCGHFMMDVLGAGGVKDLPWIVNPMPSNMMDELYEEGYSPVKWVNRK